MVVFQIETRPSNELIVRVDGEIVKLLDVFEQSVVVGGVKFGADDGAVQSEHGDYTRATTCKRFKDRLPFKGSHLY